MERETFVRIGLVVIALGALVLGLNLMNVRDDLVFLVGAIAAISGLVLGGIQLWALLKGIKK